MQICQNFTQHSKSMQNDAQKRNFKQKNIDAEYFYDIVWRDFARWVIFTDQLSNPWQTLAEPLGSAEPRLKSLPFSETHVIDNFNLTLLTWESLFAIMVETMCD